MTIICTIRITGTNVWGGRYDENYFLYSTGGRMSFSLGFLSIYMSTSIVSESSLSQWFAILTHDNNQPEV